MVTKGSGRGLQHRHPGLPRAGSRRGAQLAAALLGATLLLPGCSGSEEAPPAEREEVESWQGESPGELESEAVREQGGEIEEEMEEER